MQKTNLSFNTLRGLCEALALLQGEPIDYTQLGAETGISTPTIKKLLYALEAIFLLRLVPIEGGRKGFSVFFEDQAEGSRLASHQHSTLWQLTQFVFHQLRAQFGYRLGERVDVFQYHTRGGAQVPVCFRSAGKCLGVILSESSEEAKKALSSANSFLKTYSDSKVLILHPGKEVQAIQSRTLIAPIGGFV